MLSRQRKVPFSRRGRGKYQFPRELKVAGEGYLGVGTRVQKRNQKQRNSPQI